MNSHLGFGREIEGPLAFVSTGAAGYNLSLINMKTCDIEAHIMVDENAKSDYMSPPEVPSFSHEALFNLRTRDGKRWETNHSIYQRLL